MIELVSDPPVNDFGVTARGAREWRNSRSRRESLTPHMPDVFLTVMAPKKSKPRKKAMTLDDFAVLIQRDIARMATKDDLKVLPTKNDLWPLQRDIKTLDTNVRDLRDDVKMITDTMVSKADLANTLAEELAKSPYARQISDLQTRVNVLESKLGIKPSRRAA